MLLKVSFRYTHLNRLLPNARLKLGVKLEPWVLPFLIPPLQYGI